MQATQITFTAAGNTTSKKVELKAFTRKCILEVLAPVVGVNGLCPMDKIERMEDGSFLVLLAQEKAWTFDRHVFVA